jgi:hypothetical protein
LISDRAFEWVAPAIAAAIENGDARPPEPAWRKFEGTYRNIWGDSHVLTLEGELTMIDPTLSNPKTDAFTLEPVGENTFKLEGNGSAAIGEPVDFELGPDGTATRMTIGDGWFERVSYPV